MLYPLSEKVEIFCIGAVESRHQKKAIPVTSLKVGDEDMLRVQRGVRDINSRIYFSELNIQDYYFVSEIFSWLLADMMQNYMHLTDCVKFPHAIAFVYPVWCILICENILLSW